MAIKRMRLNDEGEFEERKLEKSELPPPPPKPVKPVRTARTSSPSKTGKNPKTSGAAVSGVKVTRRATKTYATGKSALDHDVIRFECLKCESSRVAKDPDSKLICSLCGVPMRRMR